MIGLTGQATEAAAAQASHADDEALAQPPLLQTSRCCISIEGNPIRASLACRWNRDTSPG